MSIKAEASFSLADQLFNPQSVRQLAGALQQAHPGFAQDEFESEVLARFPELALKARIDWMVTALERHLPADYAAAETVLRRALPAPLDPNKSDDDFGEFIWVVPGEYVARHGCAVATLASALDFLREATRRFSSESAIRTFLRAFPEATLEFMRECAIDRNYHVRRFAAEGIRPFLPWAERVVLPTGDILSVLELLHADPTRYVTRSVANCLNDLTRIEPGPVLRRLQSWRKLERQQSAEQPVPEARPEKRATDERITGANELGDFNLFAPILDIQANRVADNHDDGDAEQRCADDNCLTHNVEYRVKAPDPLRVDLHKLRFGEVTEFFLQQDDGLRRVCRSRAHDQGMRQRVCRQLIERRAEPGLILELLERVRGGDQPHGLDVGSLFD